MAHQEPVSRHKIKEALGEYEDCPVDKKVPKANIFRTTFHPDSDYSTFVGAYKPTKGKRPLYGLNGGLTVRLNDGEDLNEDVITYKFIPQAFLNAYMRAYQTEDKVYLIIEESIGGIVRRFSGICSNCLIGMKMASQNIQSRLMLI